MPHDFYYSKNYKLLQSRIAKQNWATGAYVNLITPHEFRHCKNINCQNTFKVKPWNPQVFCSRSCSVYTHNLGRNHSWATREKISMSVRSLPKSIYQWKILPRIKMVCIGCNKQFEVVPYLAKRRKYCSSSCAIRTIGKMTTSPKASKGKPGVRLDIDPDICFYSTWEANVARVFNLINLKWQYAPKIFDLGKHTYRPDFYLPDFDAFIEVKNFMWKYSLERDHLFRKKFPEITLELILKDDYLQIRSNYKELISNWEESR